MSSTMEFAKQFYQLSKDEVEARLQRFPNWPSSRPVDKVLPWREAVNRIVKDETKQLIRVGLVGVVESGRHLYPVRIMDVMLGHDTKPWIEAMKKNAQFEDELRGIITGGNPRPLTEEGIE